MAKIWPSESNIVQEVWEFGDHVPTSYLTKKCPCGLKQYKLIVNSPWGLQELSLLFRTRNRWMLQGTPRMMENNRFTDFNPIFKPFQIDGHPVWFNTEGTMYEDGVVEIFKMRDMSWKEVASIDEFWDVEIILPLVVDFVRGVAEDFCQRALHFLGAVERQSILTKAVWHEEEAKRLRESVTKFKPIIFKHKKESQNGDE